MMRTKRLVSAVLAVVMAVLVAYVDGGTIVYAADLGTILNPVDLGTEGSYDHVWTKYNYEAGLYATFEMKERGYTTVSTSKLINDKGKIMGYEIYIYDVTGAVVWDCDTEGQEGLPTRDYVYNVGLDKGNYTLRLSPEFSVYSGGFDCTISIKTEKNSFWEIESNNDYATATAMKLNKSYTAIYGENIGSDYGDYFKMDLKKGKTYKISVDYKPLSDKTDSTICVCLYGPDKKAAKKGYGGRVFSLQDDRSGRYSFTAKKDGYHYLKFYNEFGEGMQLTITVEKTKTTKKAKK